MSISMPSLSFSLGCEGKSISGTPKLGWICNRHASPQHEHRRVEGTLERWELKRRVKRQFFKLCATDAASRFPAMEAQKKRWESLVILATFHLATMHARLHHIKQPSKKRLKYYHIKSVDEFGVCCRRVWRNGIGFQTYQSWTYETFIYRMG